MLRPDPAHPGDLGEHRSDSADARGFPRRDRSRVLIRLWAAAFGESRQAVKGWDCGGRGHKLIQLQAHPRHGAWHCRGASVKTYR